MYTVSELQEALEELNNGAHTINNVAKLASVYTVLDHICIERGYPTDIIQPVDDDYSYGYDKKAVKDIVIGEYGNTEFLRAIKGKRPEAVWLLIDELMGTLELVDYALYNNVLNRLDSIS